MQAKEASRHLKFAVFEADLRAGELTKSGKRLSLQEQPFRLLAVLLEKPGELVTREELQGRLWPETIIDFDHGLNKAVSKVREALGDSAESPRFIETVARRGYRFLADVAVIGDSDAEPVPDASPDGRLPAPLPAPAQVDLKRPSRTTMPLLVSLGVALVAGLAAWGFYHRIHSPPAIRSLAVLPLENLSGDASQDYFVDGMTDALIIRLAKISALRVISRTSAMTYKNTRKPLSEIARELNVDAVVEGSVSRSEDRVRVAAELIDARTERHIWAESYDEDVRNTLVLQSKLSSAIADQILTAVNPQEKLTLAKSRTIDPDAYEAYVKGRYFWNKRTGESLRAAITYFKRAIVIDPAYAEAYSGLADSYAIAGDWKYGVMTSREAFPLAAAASAKALELDNSLGEAHASLAFVLDLYGWNWDAAETEFEQAIKFNPGYATAHQWYSWHLFILGRNDEAMRELRIAQTLDPFSLIINADIADALCAAHRYDEAIAQSEKTLKLDENFATGHYELGQALTQKHMYDAAIAALQKAIALSGHSGAYDSNLGYAYAVSGRRDEAIRMIHELDSRRAENKSVDADIALIDMGLGDADEAMRRLDKAYGARFKASILLRPIFDPLRSDPRFQALLRRMGLPVSTGGDTRVSHAQ
jgi:TolB-like protein/DNA-binding winged helix-turn-helix (wHTH) protein/Flp pilus assembly protein TadD